MRKSKSKPLKVVDLGTSPHGLSADLPAQHQETRCAESLLSLAAAFAVLGDELRLAVSITALPAQLGGVARSDRSASEAAKAKRLPFHYLELTDNEYMVVRAAIERWRNDMRKAVKKGKAVPADLVSEDSLWRKLQEVMALRMREAAL